MARTPYIFCPVCRFLDECSASGWSKRVDMYQCYRDARTVDLETQRGHLQRLEKVEGVSTPEDYLPRIMDLLRGAQGEVARPLEYSVSWDRHEEHWYRFSVVYWDQRPDSQRRDLEHALATSRLFGDLEEAGIREAILANIGTGNLFQILYGIDLRAEGSRQKIYLRLGRGEARWKERLISALVPGFNRDLALQSLDLVRLIGIDLKGPGSVPAVKVYYITGQVSWDRAVAMAGHHPFLESIRARCPDLREFILVQRLAADRPVVKRPDEIELHMLRNLLSMKDLWRFLEAQGSPFPMERFLGLYRSALVALTSVAFPARSMDRMNLYYILVKTRRSD